MRRLYYIADDVETTHRISDALHAEGIRDHRFHVVSRDAAGLYTHRLHAANTFQRRDIVHSGERYALIGVALAGALALQLAMFRPFGHTPGLGELCVLLVVGAFLGAWRGGLIGLKREHYKLAPFHQELEAGRYLVMVDVRRREDETVRALMRARFPQVHPAGEDSTVVNPFASPERVYRDDGR